MVDRRSSGRVAFPFQQRTCMVEPRDDTAAEIDSHLFHDVSAGGCSFWSTEPLQNHQLWIELGFGHDHLTRLAEVRHQTAIQCLARPVYLVGCRFLLPISPRPTAAPPMPN